MTSEDCGTDSDYGTASCASDAHDKVTFFEIVFDDDETVTNLTLPKTNSFVAHNVQISPLIFGSIIDRCRPDRITVSVCRRPC